MFQIIKPDTEDQTIAPENITVFLAGSIDNGKASLWSHEVQRAVSVFDFVTVFNPRREHWLSDLNPSADEPIFVEQVQWEHDHIDMGGSIDVDVGCDIPFFFFEGNSVAPITLQELGYVIGTRRGLIIPPNDGYVQPPVVVCPKEYWRRGNVELLCRRHSIAVYDTLEDGIVALKIAIESVHSQKQGPKW